MPHASDGGPRTDMVIDRETFTIRFTRTVDAAPEDVFRAWSEPGHLALWWDPSGKPLAECLIDLRVGGGFRFVSAGRPDMPFTGVYLEIEPPARLVFDANGARGIVALDAVGGKTRMLVEIICASEAHLDQYIQFGVHTGTTATLDNLVAYAADRFGVAA